MPSSMLTLTVEQIGAAKALASRIHWLEGAKDDCGPHFFDLPDCGLRVPISQELVRAEIDAALKKAHDDLGALGISLLPSPKVKRQGISMQSLGLQQSAYQFNQNLSG